MSYHQTTRTCKDCEKRHTGCHSTCEDYKAFRKERDEELAAHRREYETADYFVRQKLKGMRKKNAKIH